MRSKLLCLRSSEDRAAYKRRLRVIAACYGMVALAGFAVFALKPASTAASVTIHYPAAETIGANPAGSY